MTLVAAKDEYERFCLGVERLTGVDLTQYRRQQMERRVRAFAARRGVGENLAAYLALLRQSEHERQTFVDRVTINVSQLWRNPKQWELLRDNILPDLAGRRAVRAWSAGCSYGAEPCTLSALGMQVLPDTRMIVDATDVDASAIEQAMTGTFSKHDARDVPSAFLQRWFVADGQSWKAKPEVLRNIRFAVEDLRSAQPRPGSYDLVLCRNVVIYFAVEIREQVHELLAKALRPGGYLMVGSTERVGSAASLGLEPVLPFIYRRTA